MSINSACKYEYDKLEVACIKTVLMYWIEKSIAVSRTFSSQYSTLHPAPDWSAASKLQLIVVIRVRFKTFSINLPYAFNDGYLPAKSSIRQL